MVEIIVITEQEGFTIGHWRCRLLTVESSYDNHVKVWNPVVGR